MDPEVVERALSRRHRTYSADQRAQILGVNYAQRQRLGLRRTGSIDVDKPGRDRAREDRKNAAKRAKRAAQKASRVIERETAARELEAAISELSESMEEVSHLDAPNRLSPSLEAVISNSNRLESGESIWIRPRIIDSENNDLKTHQNRPQKSAATDPPKPLKRPESGDIPFEERVALMMEHCGLTREEAEYEAMK